MHAGRRLQVPRHRLSNAAVYIAEEGSPSPMQREGREVGGGSGMVVQARKVGGTREPVR